MKYMFASDIHGSAYYCRKMLEAFEAEGASRLFLLGDLLYHGPRNDLPKEYAPKQVIAMLNEKKQYLTNVRGAGRLRHPDRGRPYLLYEPWPHLQ